MIGAVVAAAGRSSRMGRPKPLLPWGGGTIVEHIVGVLTAGGADEIVVVTGAAAERVAEALRGSPARTAHNPRFAEGEMLESVQIGLRALSPECDAALIALGDQPQMLPETVRAVIGEYRRRREPIVCPSHRMRRGHPVLMDRWAMATLLEARPPLTLRDFLQRHAAAIRYVEVDSESVLSDVDTPEDYERARPADG